MPIVVLHSLIIPIIPFIRIVAIYKCAIYNCELFAPTYSSRVDYNTRL